MPYGTRIVKSDVELDSKTTRLGRNVSERPSLDLSVVTRICVETEHGEPELVIRQLWGSCVRLTPQEAEALAKALRPMLSTRRNA